MLPQKRSQAAEVFRLLGKATPELSPRSGMIERYEPAVVPPNGLTDIFRQRELVPLHPAQRLERDGAKRDDHRRLHQL